MFNIKNLTPYRLDDSTGKLETFQDETRINIIGKYFTFSNDIKNQKEIYNSKRLQKTDLGYKIENKYVYLIGKTHCTDDIYVSLTFCQNLKFKCNFIDLSPIKEVILKIFKLSVSLN